MMGRERKRGSERPRDLRERPLHAPDTLIFRDRPCHQGHGVRRTQPAKSRLSRKEGMPTPARVFPEAPPHTRYQACPLSKCIGARRSAPRGVRRGSARGPGSTPIPAPFRPHGVLQGREAPAEEFPAVGDPRKSPSQPPTPQKAERASASQPSPEPIREGPLIRKRIGARQYRQRRQEALLPAPAQENPKDGPVSLGKGA